MGRRRKKLPLLENLTVIDLAAEGKSIAKLNDQIIFIKQAVPGDVIDAQVVRKRKSYMEAVPVKFHHYSEKRSQPVCEHFNACGGCKWQNLPYSEQLFYKQKQVKDSLERIAKVELPEIQDIMPSENNYFYRNKLEFTFSTNRWFTEEELKESGEIQDWNALGFHVPGMFNKVVDINKCHLQGDPSNKIRDAVKAYAKANSLSFYNIREHKGFLRNLIVRTATTGDVMVIVVFAYGEAEEREKLLADLQEKVPEITSLMYVVNTKKNDTITDLEVLHFAGEDHITEKMEDLHFKIGAKSFYQTNSLQAYRLYQKVREFANLNGIEIVYDLYTGTGTIAQFVAKQALKVVGVEYVPEAIDDAHENAKINKLDNTDFFAGDLKDVLSDQFIAENGKPDVIILDPPRAGMHKNVVNQLLTISAKRIVYVSCNPATQARDINLLDTKYKLTAVQPVDMFPQTHHVENIALLELR